MMRNSNQIKWLSISAILMAFCFLCSSTALAGPLMLGNDALDNVTAGASETETNGSGGAIIGNSSEGIINQSGGVNLSGEVQSGAKALNMVNSAESTVANGVNVLDVTGLTSRLNESVALSVTQENIIGQEQRRSASMPNYLRPEGDNFVQVSISGSETHNNQMTIDKSIIDLVSKSRTAKNTSQASVDTTIAAGVTNTPSELPEASFDTNVGKGLAIAGNLEATLDGGEMQFGLAVGGAVSAFADANDSDSGFGGIEVGDAESDFTLYGRLILPELEIKINGAGCGVAMGSCDSSGTSEETTFDLNDDSIADTKESSEIGGSEFVESRTEQYRSPFELKDAQAEYIVVDDSSLTVSTTFNLLLSGSAQSGIAAMNVVNSTGSAVANGVNVARSGAMAGGNLMALTQSNVISHSR
jgi:hypothetical protein